MEQRILIGLYIGSGSASAAVMLSDKKDRTPTIITWPTGHNATVPLRVYYHDRDADAGFQWGDGVEEVQADNLFGICAYCDSSYSAGADLSGYRDLVQNLHSKRGKQYHHLPWSIYADLESISEAQLMLFIRAVKRHVKDYLIQVYSEAATSMSRSICIVTPPYLSAFQVRGLQYKLRDAFKDEYTSEDIFFLTQPQAAFLSLDVSEQTKVRVGDYLISCHMEETITTISVLRSVEHPSSMHHRFSLLQSVTLDVGCNDVFDGFQCYVEENSTEKILSAFHRNKMSAREVLADVLKARESFIKRFCDVTPEKPEAIRSKYKVASLGVKLRIPVEHMREFVFDPILHGIASRLHAEAKSIPHKSATKYILLSGPLGESPYTHDFFRDFFSSSAVILDSIDEALSTSLGAVRHMTPASTVCGFRSDNWSVEYKHIKIVDVIADPIREQEAQLRSQHMNVKSLTERTVIVRQMEMVLQKRTRFWGINTEETKQACLFLANVLYKYDFHDDAVDCISWFGRMFTQDRHTALGPGDLKSHLEGLHLAAALSDNVAIQILVATGSPFKINEKLPNGDRHEGRTPLDIYSLYCSDVDDGVEYLLEAGADESIVTAAPIAARRGHLQLLQVFQTWRPTDIKKELPNLLVLAKSGGYSETCAWLRSIGGLDEQPVTSLELEEHISNTPTLRPSTPVSMSIQIREDILELEEDGDAFLLLNQKDTTPHHPQQTVDESGVTGPVSKEQNGFTREGNHDSLRSQEAQVRPSDVQLQSPETVTCPSSVEKPNAESNTSTALRLPEDIAEPLFDFAKEDIWTRISALQKAKTRIDVPEENDPRDSQGRTALSLAAARGALRTVITLLALPRRDIDSRDIEGRTPLCWAAINNHAEVVDFLLLNKADPNIADDTGRTPISWAAARNNDLPLSSLMLKSNITARDKDGRIPLSWAAVSTSSATAGLLLAYSHTEINSIDNTGRTPLSWAAERGVPDTIWILLQHGASCCITDREGLDPLAYVGNDTPIDLQKKTILWCHGQSQKSKMALVPPDVHAQLRSNPQYLRDSVSHGNVDTTAAILALLKRDVDFGPEGHTVLHIASRRGYTRIVDTLLTNKYAVPDIDDMDNSRTPLHLAVEGGYLDVVRVLLKHGADTAISTPDYEVDHRCGMTALELAVALGRDEIAKLLQEVDSEGNKKKHRKHRVSRRALRSSLGRSLEGRVASLRNLGKLHDAS